MSWRNRMHKKTSGVPEGFFEPEKEKGLERFSSHFWVDAGALAKKKVPAGHRCLQSSGDPFS
jgi:hypothetical protein